MRKGELQANCVLPAAIGVTRIVFHVPTRGLIGYQSELPVGYAAVRAVMNRIFHAYGRRTRAILRAVAHGVLISNGTMVSAVAYALCGTWRIAAR